MMMKNGNSLKVVIKQFAIFLRAYIIARPTLKYKIIKILNYFPRLQYRLKNINVQQVESLNQNVNHLSPKARKIYKMLISAQKDVQ